MLTNFRDIGGVSVKNGRLKEGYFYRSSQLVDLDQSDSYYLMNTCKISKIYDFRSPKERKEAPDKKLGKVSYESIDLLESTNKKDSVSLQAMLKNANNIEAALLTTYEDLVKSDSASIGYRQFLEDILARNSPCIFHCFAGKDRTGVAAALILKIAGASNQDILADYLQTNQSRKKANEILLSPYKDQMDKKTYHALQTALSVKKEYLIHAADQIKERYGCFDSYLERGLGLDRDFQHRFRKQFVEI